MNIGSKLASKINNENRPPFNVYLQGNENIKSFEFHTISTYDLKKIITNMESKSSSGFDQISSKMIKKYSEILIKPLKEYFTAKNICFPINPQWANLSFTLQSGRDRWCNCTRVSEIFSACNISVQTIS